MPVTNPTRNVSPELLAAIISEAATLTACILISPETTDPVGFTAHDEDITFGGHTYYADPGLSPTEMAAAIGYSVDNLEIKGAFDEGLVKKADALGGVFDDAAYSIFVLDFENPSYGSMTVQRGTIGNVGAPDDKFSFELRSLSQKLQQNRGELTQPLCRADIFDDRCHLDPSANHPTLHIPYRYEGVAVTEVLSRFAFKVTIPAVTIPADYFEAGLLVWTGGVNAGQRSEVKTHVVTGDVHTITLQEPTYQAFADGDTLTVRKGCRKTMPACLEVENVANKRSEDYLPGLIDTLRRAGE
jgi:uncharacterized phage protein (TIGR02218 family)